MGEERLLVSASKPALAVFDAKPISLRSTQYQVQAQALMRQPWSPSWAAIAM